MTVDPPAPVDPESLRRLLAEATQGEWELEHGDIWVEKPAPIGYVPLSLEHTPADAALIVAMHAALPGLMERIALLEEALLAMSTTSLRYRLIHATSCRLHNNAGVGTACTCGLSSWKRHADDLLRVPGSLVEPIEPRGVTP